MEIKVLPFRPRNVITKKEIDGGQYQIRIDGALAGYIGYQDGAKLMLLERRSPLEQQEIAQAVAEQLAPQRIDGCRIPSVVPESTKKQDAKQVFG